MNSKLTHKDLLLKTLIVTFSALLMGFGISMYYVVGLGSDPVSTFFEALAHLFNISSGTMSIIVNIIIVVLFFKTKRHLIYVGTVIQTFFVGFGINLGMHVWIHKLPSVSSLGLAFNVLGAVLIGLSLAFYLPCNFGASPTDMIILTVCDAIKKSYKWGFYTVYGVALLTGIALGGTWGIGTLVALLLTGQVADYTLPKVKKVYAQFFKESVGNHV